jgi:nodulation protein E
LTVRRVVITGIGSISALGRGEPEFRQALRAGRPGIGPLSLVPSDDLAVKIGAEVADYDPAAHFEPDQVALLDRFAQFGLIAAREAVADAGITFAGGLAARTATLVGTGVGGQTTQDDNYLRLYGRKARRLHPFTIPRLMVNAAASAITMELGLTGPAFAVASACASATHAIGQAFHMVRAGTADVALAGGAEACITFGTMKGWEAMRVMSTDTCRPFCNTRSGMVLGEGAAMVVLEPLEEATRRGATIHAEMAGFGMSADAGDIDYVNAHGTATAANDRTETEALHRAFGEHAARLAISSTKSMHGHAMGAAGALELAATIMALEEGTLPPTANFVEADPACDLDYVPNEARQAKVRAALSNSFAFGGLNAVLALRRFDG